MKNMIGILGGMGPSATADAFTKLVSNTPATRDQEHIPVIVASLPEIPDRTECLLKNGPSPLPSMIKSLKILENAGATCIVMPCNTAHFWYEELKKSTNLCFLNIIDAVCEKVICDNSGNTAILATTATIYTQLYQNKLRDSGVPFIIPDEVCQQKVMQSIISYKSGKYQKSYEMMAECVKYLELEGASNFIMGCTEIPLILKPMADKHPDRFIDSTNELIKKAIDWYFTSDQEGVVLQSR